MRRRGGFAEAPAPSPAVIQTAYPEKARKLHREERPCNLPGCFVTWTPASHPVCTDHWLLLPWEARGAYESAYRRKDKEAMRRTLAWILGWLLYQYEHDSVPFPPDHKETWSGKVFLECSCTACTRIRARAGAIAAR